MPISMSILAKLFQRVAKVVLNAYNVTNDIDETNSYSCKQTRGIPVVDLRNENTYSFSFTTPYVKGNDVSTSLSFQ